MEKLRVELGDKLQIELNGRKFYWDDLYAFLEWFSYKMGKHTKIIIDMLMDGRLVIADVDGVTDEIIGTVYTDMMDMKNELSRMVDMNVKYAKTIDEQGKTIRELKNDRNVDLLESRLMYAEKMLDKIGMSLNYKEKLVGTK